MDTVNANLRESKAIHSKDFKISSDYPSFIKPYLQHIAPVRCKSKVPFTLF